MRLLLFQQCEDLVCVIPVVCHNVLAFDIHLLQDLIARYAVVHVAGVPSYFNG